MARIQPSNDGGCATDIFLGKSFLIRAAAISVDTYPIATLGF
jgi:hypothetical protein